MITLTVEDIRKLLKHAATEVEEIVLDTAAIADMDTTAADEIRDLLMTLSGGGVTLEIARLHAPVKEFMVRDGLIEFIGEENVYPRVLDAVSALESSRSSTGGA